MKQQKKFSSAAGIAIGPILFIIAMIAVLGAFFASGTNDFQLIAISDRVSADIVAQANLIRNTIHTCNLQYETAKSINSLPVGSTGAYPASAAEGTDVKSLGCEPMGFTSLWNNSSSNILFPPPTKGFNDWKYVNAGSAGGRCIWTTPSVTNPSGNAGIVDGLTHAATKFHTSTSVDLLHEAIYAPASASQKFVLWITLPATVGGADSHCEP